MDPLVRYLDEHWDEHHPAMMRLGHPSDVSDTASQRSGRHRAKDEIETLRSKMLATAGRMPRRPRIW